MGVALAIRDARDRKAAQSAAARITVRVLTGSEKEAFLSDAEVAKVLDAAGIAIIVQKAGSREIATRPDRKSLDVAYPADAHAAVKISQTTGSKRIFSTLYAPIAAASWKTPVPVLGKAAPVSEIARSDGVLVSGEERKAVSIGDMDADGPLNTVVVVGNDRSASLKEVSVTLQKAGFVVVTASSARAALDRCREQHHPVDLAVIDTAASGITRPEVERRLYEMYPHVRMLFLSDDNPETVHETDSLGHVRRILRKPYRRSRFLGRVLEMTQQPRVMRA